MNKHIELAKRFLANSNSVTLVELDTACDEAYQVYRASTVRGLYYSAATLVTYAPFNALARAVHSLNHGVDCTAAIQSYIAEYERLTA